MAAFQDAELASVAADMFRGMPIGPMSVDSQIRSAITLCWLMLPDEKKDLEIVSQEFRRLVERALANFAEDTRLFKK